MRRAEFRKKKQNRLAMLSITVVVAMLFVVITINSFKLRSKQLQCIEKEEELTRQIEAENERTEELKELKKYTKTKKYAEEVAKEKLGLVYDDEIVFQPDK